MSIVGLLAAAFVLDLTASEPVADIGGDMQPDARTGRWEQTVRNFELMDAKTPPPDGAVLLVGGSNARRWTDVDEYFPEFRLINRGFGGARLTEILHFVDRIIIPYSPTVILVNAGGNDLSAGSSPEQIRDTAKTLIATVRTELPNVQIYFIGLPYVRRASGNPEVQSLIRQLNAQFAELAEMEEMVTFIDLVPAFLDDKGAFQPDLFVEDGTHFSAKGYAVVAGLLRDKL